ncbi:MAG: NAD(P)-binding domain-containing protein [Sphaerospermopsis kisseleviana]|jgi:cation diffusion facilitator CzcD-associated flavoprotein CzcO|uniref:NAD(P)-binding domain-containing protein n=1 Tax=Sphaerospermopsis sp. LEGE 00249 TaxID=1380707 RepID=UPI00164DAF59|nr:NAD(P)-binding domain-containing protein [Sphaerospermopsis sp. LEGE 00249]MBC5793747.1 NAD(P)-binding domain-containing protein [Sphaerospermopsis sp. LEGE 00249]
MKTVKSAQNSTRKCKVAVIGAGASGIATAKCLMEDGHEPTVFERGDQVGGVWVFNKTNGRAFSTVHFQHSKYVSVFSDYPMSMETNEFPHYTEVLQYLNDYVDHFDIRKNIKFNTPVDKVVKTDDGWDVTISYPGGQATFNFDAIAVCSGIYNDARWPGFPGEEKFKGKIIHSKDYKDPSIFTDKNVLILGNGPSGVDIAVTASYNSNKTIWSYRKNRWLLPRYCERLPFDFIVTRLNKHIPFRHQILSLVHFQKFYPIMLDHIACGVKPDVGPEKSGPVFNEDALNRIRLGAIKNKPNISHFQEDKVVFEDGSSEAIDIVVYATGYQVKIPFMDEYLGEDHQKNLNLYKMVFHPELPNCGFIGFVYGNVIFPTSELQARWFSKVISGELELPSKVAMEEQIAEHRKHQEEGWIESAYRSLRVSAFDYMDDIAKEINALPKLWENWKILKEIFTGPMLSTQYRIDGPNKWQGAISWIKQVPKLVRK